MAEKTPAVKEEQKLEQQFALQRVYLKDFSLEMPNAPQIFLDDTDPAIEAAINVGAERLAESVFESTVRVTVTTRIDETVVYLIEITQAGIFQIENIPEDQLDPLLGVVCPSILFPYLRANVADAITRTTLPPLHLQEVDFQSLYQQKLAEITEATAESDKKSADKAD